ncbi:MAG: XdhC family protein, partial [Thermoplasmata archaeon]
FLIVLADQPFVSSATLDALIAHRDDSRADILIPTYRGRRGNPVLVGRSLSDEIQSIAGDQGCRAIFGRHLEGILEVPVEDPGILIDLDTPEQVARAEEAVREGQPIDCLLADIASTRNHVHSSATRSSAASHPDVFALAQELRSRNEPFVLATVVRVERPSSGRPGFKAIVRANRELIGWLGGSCAQSVLVAESLRALRDGRPRLLRLAPDADPSAATEGVVEYVMECESGGTMEIYVEPHLPKPQLLVVGDSPVAQALLALGGLLDYRVVLVAPGVGKAAFPGADRVVTDLAEIPDLVTPETFAVVATMGKYDETALTKLAGSRAAYVGLVASRRRAAAVLDGLASAGVAAEARSRIISPAGLDLSAETPEEIALSIVAQVTQVRRTAGPRELPVSEAPSGSGVRIEQDVVCGMDVPSDAPIRATHAGTVYVFCSEGCRARFLKTPKTFLA